MDNLAPFYAAYWNSTAIGAAVTCGIAALIAYFQSLRRGKRRSAPPQQPFKTVAEIVFAWSLAYPLAGWVGQRILSPRPVLLFWIVGSLLSLVPLVGVFVFDRAARLQISAARTETVSARKLLGSFQTATNIEATYKGDADPALLGALANDSQQSAAIRVTSVGLGALDARKELWGVLWAAAARGVRVRVLSDSPLASAGPAIEFRRVPELFGGLLRGVLVIDVGGPLYFGVGSAKDLATVRFSTNRGSGVIGTAISRIFEHLDTVMDSAASHAVSVRVATSPADYKQMILGLESGASEIDRIPKRIFVVFKSTETVQRIAEQRYGVGSDHIRHYIEEHRERTQGFYNALGRGMVCREIYNKAELLAYVKGMKHGIAVTLTKTQMEETVVRWRDAIRTQQQGYFVGLADAPLPFKYELIDRRHFLIHEAIGHSDEGRLNAFCVTGEEFSRTPVRDFEMIWNSIPPDERTRDSVVRWIESHLLPVFT